MEIRPARTDELDVIASLAAAMQSRPDRQLTYLSVEAAAIAEELDELGDWTATSAIAEIDGEVVGWLIGETDDEVGRVWWLGPAIVDGHDWPTTATALYEAAAARLPDGIGEEEFAVPETFVDLIGWSAELGFTADPGSLGLDLRDDPITGHVRDDLTIRPVGPTDLGTIDVLHDRLFPDTHRTGRQIVEESEARYRRLVAELDGTVLGYVAAEIQADGSGYIDYLGVEPDHQRGGVGTALVAAAATALRAAGAGTLHLTVREANTVARGLYGRLGFVEDVVLVPLRKGFTLP
ncbi:MAG: GNAT family N-acetyltransferase [Actinomycetota bacterium]